MLRLLIETLRRRWLLSLCLSLFAGALVGFWETVYERRSPSAWGATYVWMVIAGSAVPLFQTELETREKRAVLLKTLPVTTLSAAVARFAGPLLLFVPVLLTTLLAAWGFGAFTPSSARGLQLVAVALVMMGFYSLASLWAELSPRFLAIRYGRLLYFGIPTLAGAGAGVATSIQVDRLFDEFEAADRQVGLVSLLAALIDQQVAGAAALLTAGITTAAVVLFLRRESYT